MNDVIVVGAGPAGSYVAGGLAQQGYDVLVLEEHPHIGKPVQCTGIIGRECVEHFPIPEKVVLKRVNSARFFSPSGESLMISHPEVQAYIIDRAAFDWEMAERAKAQGAHYLLNAKVIDLQVTDSCVRVVVNHQATSVTLKAKTAVIASGFGSRLPQKVGLGKVGDFVMGAQAKVGIERCPEVEVYFSQEKAQGFFAWLVPLSSDRGLAGLFSRRKAASLMRNFLSYLHHQGKITAAQAEITFGAIPLKPLPKTFHPRLLVVGDAAGQVKPTTGGGIYYSLLCAQIAAETLHQALSAHDFSDKLLARYQKRWKRRLGKELQVGYYARRLYERLGDSQIEELFYIIKSNGLHQSLLQAEDFSFDWHGSLITRALSHEAVLKALWQMKGVLLPLNRRSHRGV